MQLIPFRHTVTSFSPMFGSRLFSLKILSTLSLPFAINPFVDLVTSLLLSSCHDNPFLPTARRVTPVDNGSSHHSCSIYHCKFDGPLYSGYLNLFVPGISTFLLTSLAINRILQPRKPESSSPIDPPPTTEQV